MQRQQELMQALNVGATEMMLSGTLKDISLEQLR